MAWCLSTVQPYDNQWQPDNTAIPQSGYDDSQYVQATSEPAWWGFDSPPLPTSTPHATLSNLEEPQQFFPPDQGNTATWSEPPVLSQHIHPDNAFPDPDFGVGYGATAHSHPLFSPFGTAIYEPNTLLASYPVQCTSQDAPYTLPSFNIDPPAMPFAPVLPNLPRYPGAEPSFMPPHNYEQHENSATHVDEAAAPPISAGSVGQVVAQGQKRKREGEHTTKTRKPRTTSQDKYPELDRLTDCFPADPSRRTNIPRVPRKIAARLSSLPQSFRPPPPLDAAPAPCLPSPNQDYSRTTHPAIHPIAPSQLPPNGGAGLRPNATTLPKALVDHLSLVRIEALLCGPHYRPFPRDTKTVISLYRGPALEARRQREGDSFYGNEFIHPQTGEPFVLRVDSLQDILYDLHQRTVEAGMQWTVGQGHMPPEAGPHIPSIQPSPSYYAALHFSEPQVPGLMPDNPPIFPSRPSLHGMHVPASHSHGSPPISDEPESQGPSSIQHSEPLKSAYLYQELFGDDVETQL